MVLGPGWCVWDWFAQGRVTHNATVTITHPNGSVLKATVLSCDEHAIRAIVPGSDDTLVFTRTRDTWVSEELDPVTARFDWQRGGPAPTSRSDDDYVCPKALAAYLLQSLNGGRERGASGGDCASPGIAGASTVATSPDYTRALLV